MSLLRDVPYALTAAFLFTMGAIVTWYLTSYFFKYLRPPTEIYVDVVKWDGKDSELADTVRERFSQYAGASADVDQTQEVLFAKDHLGRAQEQLKELKVDVAGVSVVGAIGVFEKIVNPPYRVLAVSGETHDDTHFVVARLKQRGNVLREWRLSQSFESTKSNEAKSALIDATVFKILFDLGRERAVAGSKKDFPNERALEAFILGADRFEAYLTNQRQADLEKAIERLSIVNWEMPEYEPGLDLFALALAENRREDEAIAVYGRLLGGDGPLHHSALNGLDWNARARKYQLELNRAQAHYFRYTVQATATAAAHLTNLRTLMVADLQQASSAAKEPVAKLQSLNAYANAQLADVTGHLLTFAKRDPIDDVDLISALNAARTAASPAPVRNLSGNLSLAQFAREVMTAHRALIDLANSADSAASDYWKSSNPDAESERRTLQRLIHSALGYTRYHYARLTATDSDTFKQECRDAIGELERARAAQPQHYTVLQNLGLIYADEAIRENAELSIATRYFQRSVELKPNDYWGHRNLAEIFGRRLERRVDATELLKQARSHADKALDLRPDDPDLDLVSARVAMWEWADAAPADRDKRRNVVNALLELGKSGDRLDVLWAKAAWAVHAVRGFQPTKTAEAEIAAEFETARIKALAAVKGAAEAYDDAPTWVKQQTAARLHAAQKELKSVSLEGRGSVTALF